MKITCDYQTAIDMIERAKGCLLNIETDDDRAERRTALAVAALNVSLRDVAAAAPAIRIAFSMSRFMYELRRVDRDFVKEIEKHDNAAAQKFTRAQTLLSAALSSNPENVQARTALGELYLDRFLNAEKKMNSGDV